MGWPVAAPAVPAPEVTTSVCCEACKTVAGAETMRNFGLAWDYWLCLDMAECLARQIARHITDPGSGTSGSEEETGTGHEAAPDSAGAGEAPEPDSSEGAER